VLIGEPEALFHRQDEKDAKFSQILRVLCVFAVRLQTILIINTQERDYHLWAIRTKPGRALAFGGIGLITNGG
jgi:hypothetical protein